MMYLVLQITPDLRVFRIPEYLVTPAESDALASWPETAKCDLSAFPSRITEQLPDFCIVPTSFRLYTL